MFSCSLVMCRKMVHAWRLDEYRVSRCLGFRWNAMVEVPGTVVTTDDRMDLQIAFDCS